LKFKITGKGDTQLTEIKKFLDIFIEECKRQYVKQIKGSKMIKATTYINKASPVPVQMNLPDELFMGYYIENNSMIVGLPHSSGIRFIDKRASKKMKKNLEGYLKSRGINCDVEVLKEE